MCRKCESMVTYGINASECVHVLIQMTMRSREYVQKVRFYDDERRRKVYLDLLFSFNN